MPVRKDYKASVVHRAKAPKPPKLPRTPEERKRFFAHMARGFLVAFAAFALVLFVFWGSGVLRQWVESMLRGQFIAGLQNQEQTTPAQETPFVPGSVVPAVPSVPQETQQPTEQQSFFHILQGGKPTDTGALVPSSFSDLFSGVAWLDQVKTTLYNDRAMTSLIFPPDVTWEKASFPDDGNFISPAADGSETRCVGSTSSPQVGSVCLKKQGNALTLNGQAIALPSEMRAKTIVNISIGALSSRFVVGIVTKNGGYEGWVYSFDPTTSVFQKVFGEANTPFLSQYEGKFGFGGTDDDWLAIYGGYEGIAYRIRAGKPFTNISRFFGIRVMENGFEPSVIRSVTVNCKLSTQGGSAYGGKNDNCVSWYVWSLTPNNPHLIKLYENPDDGTIAGAFDFTPRLFGSASARQASFRLGPSTSSGQAGTEGNTLVLEAKVESGGGTEMYVFRDNGFKSSNDMSVESVNINNYPAEVVSATIVDDDLFLGNASVRFYLSNNGSDWVESQVGQETNFPDSHGHQLLWRAVFAPGGNSASTPPYFDRVRIDYKVKFL